MTYFFSISGICNKRYLFIRSSQEYRRVCREKTKINDLQAGVKNEEHQKSKTGKAKQ